LIIAVVDGAKLTAAGNTPTIMLALGNGETLTGGGGNDTFYATVGGGSNTLTGGGGTNTYDLSRTPAGTNTVNLQKGTNGTAKIAGGGTDTLNQIQNVIGGSGSNDLTGNGAGSVLTGGVGSVAGSTNILRDGNPVNGTGSATMIGNSTNDQFFVNSANDTVTENFNNVAGTATDVVLTTLNTYTLGTNVENLTFIGTGTFTGTGNGLNNAMFVGANITAGVTLDGGAGNDNLIGGKFNDVLIGGVGNDNMTGNGVAGSAGSDTFKYLTAGFGKDIITDFGSTGGTTQDFIDLSAFVPAANFATLVKSTQSGANVLVTVGNGTTTGGTILLMNTTLANITAADFKLA
jgi:Ca2+-binding RTX toxin-like protein